ncbi:unnamed protein product [Mytilus coruscus]|uniref:Uncharacterized protein n=1 Tax=Mytilus coruscus TaxID=42192 RepID=A0A6J8DRS6_MYTCO|nr:unnamed protein product [Mytilus coruscus]
MGNMCLGGIHVPDDVNAYLTHLAPDGRASILQPSPYNYDVHECFGCGSVNFGVSQKKDDTITSAIFERTVQHDKPGLSIEDRQFLTLMQTNLQDKDVCNESEAIDWLNRTTEALKIFGNLRQHKFSSNSSVVRAALKSDDLAENLEKRNVDTDDLPLQRSLGLYWDLQSDTLNGI